MRNSKCVIKIVLFLAVVLTINGFLSYALIPPNVMRMNYHLLKNQNQYDYVFIGTSHGQNGIDPKVIDEVTGDKSINLCMPNMYERDMYYVLKEACRKQQPKKVIYELDPAYWMLQPTVEPVSNSFFYEMPFSMNKAAYFFDKIRKEDFRKTLFPWSYCRYNYREAKNIIKKKLSKEYREFKTESIEVPNGHYKGKGFVYLNRRDDKGPMSYIPWDSHKVHARKLEYFKKIIQLCKEKNIELEIVTLPMPQETIDKVGENYGQAIGYFKELAGKYQVNYVDFSTVEKEVFDRDIMQYDDHDGHLNGNAGEEFSRILGGYLASRNSAQQD